MHKGKRDALVVRIPFCMDSSSGGRPSELQLQIRNEYSSEFHGISHITHHYVLISTSLLSCSSIRYGSTMGISRATTSFSQSSNTISFRNSHENAEVYARKEDDTKHVPIVFSFSSCRFRRSISHRFFSELSPVMSLSAAACKYHVSV